jgi:hypothetical protein
MHVRRVFLSAVSAFSLVAITGCATDNPVSSVGGIDATAPGAPTSLAAEQRGSNLVLSWDASVDPDVAGYDVYRFAPDPARENSYVKVNSALVTDTEYTVPEAPSSTSWYRVKAVDASANASAASGALAAAAPGGSSNVGNDPSEPGVAQQSRP